MDPTCGKRKGKCKLRPAWRTSESKEDSSSMEEEVALLRLRVVVLQSQLEGLMMGGARPEGISGLKQVNSLVAPSEAEMEVGSTDSVNRSEGPEVGGLLLVRVTSHESQKHHSNRRSRRKFQASYLNGM